MTVERSCGNCSLCCKLPMIEVLSKPADTWCKHCKPGLNGCTIYDNRPEICAQFQCEWVKGNVDDIWKPTSAKMVLHVSEASQNGFMFFNVMVDGGSPGRWREAEYYTRLKHMALLGTKHKVLVRVQVGKKSWIILPQGDVEVPSNAKGFDIRQNALGLWNLVFFTGEKTDDDRVPQTG